MKRSDIEKYGSINPIHNAEVLKKQQKTNLEKYGHVCSLHGEEIKEKAKAVFF